MESGVLKAVEKLTLKKKKKFSAFSVSVTGKVIIKKDYYYYYYYLPYDLKYF